MRLLAFFDCGDESVRESFAELRCHDVPASDQEVVLFFWNADCIAHGGDDGDTIFKYVVIFSIPELASLMAGLVQEYCSRGWLFLLEILWLANDPFGNVCLTGILRRISSDVRLGLCRPYESR